MTTPERIELSSGSIARIEGDTVTLYDSVPPKECIYDGPLKPLLELAAAMQGEGMGEDLHTIKQRDEYHDKANQLAAAVGAYFGVDCGEHTSLNCPWDEALSYLKGRTATHPPASANPVTPSAESVAREDVRELPYLVNELCSTFKLMAPEKAKQSATMQVDLYVKAQTSTLQARNAALEGALERVNLAMPVGCTGNNKQLIHKCREIIRQALANKEAGK